MAGRPKKPAGEAKTFELRIRVTEQQRRMLDEAAKTKELDTSTWARAELLALAKKLLAEGQ